MNILKYIFKSEDKLQEFENAKEASVAISLLIEACEKRIEEDRNLSADDLRERIELLEDETDELENELEELEEREPRDQNSSSYLRWEERKNQIEDQISDIEDEMSEMEDLLEEKESENEDD